MEFYKKYKLVFIVGITCLFVGRYVLTPKKEIEIREVIKYVESKKENKQTNKVTRIKEEKKPDGSVVTETVVNENSNSQTQTNINYQSDRTSKSKSKSNIIIGISAIKNIEDFSKKPDFSITTIVPIFGNISAIGSLDTTKKVGLGIALEF